MEGCIVIKQESGGTDKQEAVVTPSSVKVVKVKTLRKRKSRRSPKEAELFKIKKEFPELSGRQLFRKQWMELPMFKDWLVEGILPSHGFCNFCCVGITAHKTELISHSRSKRHIRKRNLMQIKNTSSVDDHEDVTAIVDESGSTHLLRIIDLRCDSLSVPSLEMRKAMVDAPGGDTAFGTDKAVEDLEKMVAGLLEKEAALFFPTHVMANMVAVLTHCQSRGSAVIVGKESDINVKNKEALIKFGGLHVCPVREEGNGTFCLESLDASLSELDLDAPLTGLVCYECAHARQGGRVPPIAWIDQLSTVCSLHKVSLHCDGTRLVNASLSKNLPPSRLVKGASSVTFALDKALGAPVGAVLVGTEEFLMRASHIRNFLGGNIHQAGIFASAGHFALSKLLASVDQDHEKARGMALAIAIGNSPAISVNVSHVETNIVGLQCKKALTSAVELKDRLASVSREETEACDGENIIVLGDDVTDEILSLYLHNKVSDVDVRAVIKKMNYIMGED